MVVRPVEMTQSKLPFTLTALVSIIGMMKFFWQPEAEIGSTTVASGENLEGSLTLDPEEIQVFAIEDLKGKKVTGAQA